MMTRGGRGCPKFDDVICERPLKIILGRTKCFMSKIEPLNVLSYKQTYLEDKQTRQNDVQTCLKVTNKHAFNLPTKLT